MIGILKICFFIKTPHLAKYPSEGLYPTAKKFLLFSFPKLDLHFKNNSWLVMQILMVQFTERPSVFCDQVLRMMFVRLQYGKPDSGPQWATLFGVSPSLHVKDIHAMLLQNVHCCPSSTFCTLPVAIKSRWPSCFTPLSLLHRFYQLWYMHDRFAVGLEAVNSQSIMKMSSDIGDCKDLFVFHYIWLFEIYL